MVPSAGKCSAISRKHHVQQFLGTASAIASDISPSSAFLQAFIAEYGVMRHGIVLWPAWVSYPGCPPSQTLANRQPNCWEKEKALTLCKQSFQHWLGHKSQTQCRTGCYEENQLHPKQSHYKGSFFSSNPVASTVNAIKHCWQMPFMNSTKAAFQLCSPWSLHSQEAAFLSPAAARAGRQRMNVYWQVAGPGHASQFLHLLSRYFSYFTILFTQAPLIKILN